jgi:hypothetical protein
MSRGACVTPPPFWGGEFAVAFRSRERGGRTLIDAMIDKLPPLPPFTAETAAQ